LQWYDFRQPIARSDSSNFVNEGSTSGLSGTSTPTFAASRKAHKFFDSYPQYERKAADIYARNGTPTRIPGRGSPDSIGSEAPTPTPREYLNIPAANVIDSAHYGYIYCMALFNKGDQGVYIATGSGDETVKVHEKF